MRFLAYLVIIAVSWALAFACGSDERPPADSLDDIDAGAEGGAGGEGSTEPPDPPDPCIPEPEDPIDPEDEDQNCDGVDGVAEDNVYVALTGDNSNLGTRDAPFRTIGHALEVAGGRPVFVAVGTYDEDLTVTTDKLILLGGYSPESGWRRVSDDDRSILLASAQGLRVRDLTEDSVIGGMQIEAADAAEDSPGGSSVAVSVGGSGTALFVWKSDIFAGQGTPGEDGADGPDHAEAGRDDCIPAGAATGESCRRLTPQGASGGSACQCGELETDQIAPGSPGCGDTRSRGGDGGIAGTPPEPGGAGNAAGNNGRIGAQGGPADLGEPIGTFALEEYEPPQGPIASQGQSGGGGGGGRVGSFLSGVVDNPSCGAVPPCQNCAAHCSGYPYPEGLGTPQPGWCSAESADPSCMRCITCSHEEMALPGGGAGGGGSCGGEGGTTGSGGGASVGVIAEGVVLRFEDVRVSTDSGGRGGNGGDGGLAAPGECGGLGAQGACALAAGPFCSSGMFGVPRQTLQCREGGDTGGDGGRGGPGGNGAGGSGGPSIGVVLLDGASLEETGSLYETEASVPGDGGTIGTTPGPNGEPGVRAACWPSDLCP